MNPKQQDQYNEAQVALVQAQVKATAAKAAMFVAIGFGAVMFGLAVLL